MQSNGNVSTVKGLLKTELAKPWHYRREGIYYLRIRPVGRTATLTISLRTSDRAIAMQRSHTLLTTLRTFHLDKPDATWEQLRDRLREIGEDTLATPNEWELLDTMGLVYADMSADLKYWSRTGAQTVAQAKAANGARVLLAAAEERLLTGDSGPLIEFIENLDETPGSAAAIPLDALQPAAEESGEPLTFEKLSEMYLADQGSNMKESTLKNTTYQCRSLAEVCGELDLTTHTRADLVAVKSRLVATRKGSTVNALLARLSTVLSWGVNNGHLERAFDKKLKLAKGADSSREALTQEQVQQLMDAVSKWPATKWERWFITLGCITGARLGEIYYLLKEDVREVDGGWVIDINEGEGKSLKNEYSARLVPLIDGAYGFDLKAFLEFVGNMPKGARLSKTVYKRVSMDMNVALKEIMGDEKDSTTTFHSLRHSLASLLKTTGTPLEAAQSILGHSSNSITYDHYGAGSSLQLGIIKDALKKALPIKEAEPS